MRNHTISALSLMKVMVIMVFDIQNHCVRFSKALDVIEINVAVKYKSQDHESFTFSAWKFDFDG